MKILTICQRGNSRSVALAYIIKKNFHHEAIAIGIRQHTHATKKMLFDWADLIILVDKEYIAEIPIEYTPKLKVWDVGKDKYFRGFDPDLLDQYSTYIKKEGFL